MKFPHLKKSLALPVILLVSPLSCTPPEEADEMTLEDVTPQEVVVTDLSILAESSWRLVDFYGASVADDAGMTLTFGDDGRVSGGASVNRFNGPIELSSDAIQIGPFATTRMAGPPEAMERERDYLAALAAMKAIHQIGDDKLVVLVDGRELPMRFEKMESD